VGVIVENSLVALSPITSNVVYTVKFNDITSATQAIENPRVPGSIPGPGTTYIKKLIIERCSAFLLPAI